MMTKKNYIEATKAMEFTADALNSSMLGALNEFVVALINNKECATINGYYGFSVEHGLGIDNHYLCYQGHKLFDITGANADRDFNELLTMIEADELYVNGVHEFPAYPIELGEDDGMLVMTINNYDIFMGPYQEFDSADDLEELKFQALYLYRCANR